MEKQRLDVIRESWALIEREAMESFRDLPQWRFEIRSDPYEWLRIGNPTPFSLTETATAEYQTARHNNGRISARVICQIDGETVILVQPHDVTP